MRKWSLVISLFYAVVVLVLLLPAAVGLAEEHPSPADIYTYSKQMYAYWFTWVWLGILIVGQFLLLGLTVDTTERRLKPRTHIVVSSITTGLLLAMLMFTGACSLAVAIKGDRLDDWAELVLLGGFVLPWLVWGILFYRFARGSSDVVTRAVRWLFRGSCWSCWSRCRRMSSFAGGTIAVRRELPPSGSQPASPSCCFRSGPACCFYIRSGWRVLEHARPGPMPLPSSSTPPLGKMRLVRVSRSADGSPQARKPVFGRVDDRGGSRPSRNNSGW